MAQSAKIATWVSKHIRKEPETKEAPGFVLMVCNAGRTVLAVEFTDPETRPSALPRTTSIVPKYEGSSKVSRACSSVSPLLRRNSHNLSVMD